MGIKINGQSVNGFMINNNVINGLMKNTQIIYRKATNVYNVEILESIESDGYAYIDTGLYLQAGLSEIYTEVTNTATKTVAIAVMGSNDSSPYSANSNQLRITATNRWVLDWNGGYSSPSDAYVNQKTIFERKTDGTYVDGVFYERLSDNGIRQATTFAVFKTNREDLKPTPVTTDFLIHKLEIQENDISLANLIPVRILETDEICLYDYITQAYFKNLGAGSFIGHSKETPEYAYVEVAEVEGAVSAINAMGVIAEDTVAGQLNQLEELGVDINA